MSTDKLEDLITAARRQPGARERATGMIKFQCAACAAEGHDAHQDNAGLFLRDGTWGCAFASGDPALGRKHWEAIGEALGAFKRRNGHGASARARAPASAEGASTPKTLGVVAGTGAPDARGSGDTRAVSPERPQPGAVLVRLADVQKEPVKWLWANRIALGKLTLIVGDVGAGKTYLTSDISARVTQGRAWPDGAPAAAPGHVILLTSEDGIADTLRPRLDRQGGDATRVDVLRAVQRDAGEVPFNLERDLPALDVALGETRAVVAFMDPLSAYLGTKDSYKDAEIRGLLTPLADLAERRRVAIVGLLHLTKAQQRRILHRVQASIAFVAQARTVLAVGEDPDTPGRRLVAPLKNNLGPFPPVLAFRISDAGLCWEPGTVEGTADVLLAGDDAPTRAECQEIDRAVRFLRDELADGPVRSTEILKDAKANGVATRTLWRAKAGLRVPAHRQGQGPWYWMLPHAEEPTA